MDSNIGSTHLLFYILFNFHSNSKQLNGIWTEIEQKSNRIWKEIEWKLSKDNESSVQGAWPAHTCLEPLTDLLLCLLNFRSISVQFFSISAPFSFNFWSIFQFSIFFQRNICLCQRPAIRIKDLQWKIIKYFGTFPRYCC